MINRPLVSIIIPTYNRQQTLPETIRSVRNQTYPHWELIVVDDRSTDDTEQLIAGYSREDQRIRYWKNCGRKGPAAARNAGILCSSGEYIAFLDSDDQWYENHLQDSLEAMQAENVSVCFAFWQEKAVTGEIYGFTEDERFIDAVNAVKAVRHDNRILFPAYEFCEYTALRSVHYCHINTMVFKKSIIRNTGLLNEKLPASEDMEFIFRVHYAFPFCLITAYHFIYNQNSDSLYSFTDRKKLDKEAVISNAGLVKRLTFCGTATCKMWQLKIAFIKRTRQFKNKKKCIQKCNNRIAIKYFSLAYMNKKVNKINAVIFLLKSLVYGFSWGKIQLMINILFPFIFRHLDPKLHDYWLY